MISKTIGYNGVHYFQTNPFELISRKYVARIHNAMKSNFATRHLERLALQWFAAPIGRPIAFWAHVNHVAKQLGASEGLGPLHAKLRLKTDPSRLILWLLKQHIHPLWFHTLGLMSPWNSCYCVMNVQQLRFFIFCRVCGHEICGNLCS